MKKIIIILYITTLSLSAQTPFNKGVNLTDWFQESNISRIQFGKYTKQDFRNIKSLGADVIRLPINLHIMTDGAPNYNLDETFLFFLDSAVTWAEELNINLILDNHTFDPGDNTDPNVEEILIPVWRHMAEHYKDRSQLIYYEILNEPHGISLTKWNTIQENVINAIREIDSVHTIIVGAANWNSYDDLNSLPIYSDTNLIYTFHFYAPFLFTHQGASWTDPSMEALSLIPFPYSSDKMPQFPNSLAGTWIASSFNNYKNEGNIESVKQLIDIAVDFQQNRNVTVFCGELGVYRGNVNNDDRVEWYRAVREYLEEKNIPWTSWDYKGSFGVFNYDSDEFFNSDLNLPLLSALGFNSIEQEKLIIYPDSSSILLYDDYVKNIAVESSYSANSDLNFYNEDSRDGKYAIHWADAAQYDFLQFDFRPNRDFTYLFTTNINLHISIKGSIPNSSFDIRFVDTKTDVPEDRPWRMRITINDAIGGSWDNQWRDLVIPLSSFKEQGSWDGQWYDPIGAFDWSRIDVFELVAEEASAVGKEFWFDNIYFDWSTVDIENNKLNNEFALGQNYPNPFNPSTTIEFSIPNKSFVSLKVYDILGKEVTNLISAVKNAGNYSINFNADNLSSGLLFYQLKVDKMIETKKMMFLK